MIPEEQTTGFSNLSVRNFRRLKNVQLDFRPLTVLIGVNGSGKTSILDPPDAAGAICTRRTEFLHQRPFRFVGVDHMRFRQRTLRVDIEGHAALHYGLYLKAEAPAYVVSKETLSKPTNGYSAPLKHIDSHGPDIKYFDTVHKKLIRPAWQHNPLETSLSQMPKTFRGPGRISPVSHFHRFLRLPGYRAAFSHAGPSVDVARNAPWRNTSSTNCGLQVAFEVLDSTASCELRSVASVSSEIERNGTDGQMAVTAAAGSCLALN